jgi:hypothetical protein
MTEAVTRAPKRRKIIRVRRQEEDAGDTSDAINLPAWKQSADPENTAQADLPRTNDGDGNNGASELSVTEILRRRKTGKQRRAGIEFSNTRTGTRSNAPPTSTALVPIDERQNALESTTNRFTPQTGQVADTQDKHM